MRQADRNGEPGLMGAVVRFCRLLREHEFLVAPMECADALRATTMLGVADRAAVHLAMRAVLTSRHEELDIFDTLFERFWSGALADAPTPLPAPELLPPKPRDTVPASLSMDRWLAAPRGDLETVEAKSASHSAAGSPVRMGRSSADELRTIERVARAVARRLARQPSRRWKASERGRRIDLRASMRRSLPLGGEVAQMARRAQRLRKLRLVTVCDVSGSMDLYARFFLQFVSALQRSTARVESFAFATGLTRITGQLASGHPDAAMAAAAHAVRDWSAGTRIGESLAILERHWSRYVDRNTILVILSDGWDTGDPALLAATLERLAARSRRIIWLNPLLGSARYRPETAGMRAALPYIDVLAPLNDIGSLRALPRVLFH